MNNEKLVELELLNQQLMELENSILMAEEQIIQLESSKEALQNLEKGCEEVLIPLSSGIFIPVKNVDLDKIKIMVGANVVVEKNSTEAILKIDEYLADVKKHRDASIDLFDKVSLKAIQTQQELDEA